MSEKPEDLLHHQARHQTGNLNNRMTRMSRREKSRKADIKLPNISFRGLFFLKVIARPTLDSRYLQSKAPILAPMPFETLETLGFIDMLLAPYGLH